MYRCEINNNNNNNDSCGSAEREEEPCALPFHPPLSPTCTRYSSMSLPSSEPLDRSCRSSSPACPHTHTWVHLCIYSIESVATPRFALSISLGSIPHDPPTERCTKPYCCTSFSHCVPLPAPGPPSTNTTWSSHEWMND